MGKSVFLSQLALDLVISRYEGLGFLIVSSRQGDIEKLNLLFQLTLLSNLEGTDAMAWLHEKLI